MNILIISPNSPFLSVGGIERYVYNLINFCKTESGTYHFLLPTNGRNKDEKLGNVEIHSRDFLFLSPNKHQKKINQHSIIRTKSTDFFEYLHKFVIDQKIDCIVAENFHLGLPPAYSLMLSMISVAHTIPVFLQVHSFATNDLQTELINTLFWQNIFCVSKSVAGDCFRKGAPIKQLVTRYLGVNTDEFSPELNKVWLKKTLKLPKETKIILCASRILQGYSDILQEKGIINLLDAFSKLSSRDPDSRLLIAIGTPPKQLAEQFVAAIKKLEGFIQIHGIADKIILKQFSLENMPKVYAGSDLFVLTSENETLGQIFLEAMAVGLPVIGTNVGGIPEIIADGYNGVLVSPNNPTQLQQKMHLLLHDKDLRNKFIENGTKTVLKHFQAKKIFKEYFHYIEQQIKKK